MGLLRYIILGMLVASGVAIGFSGFAGDLITNSGGTLSKNLSSLSFVGEIQNATQAVANDFQNSQISTSVFAMPLLIATGVYDIVKLLLVSVSNIFTLLVDGVFGLFPGFIPFWVRGIVISAVVIIIVFEIVSSVLKWNI